MAVVSKRGREDFRTSGEIVDLSQPAEVRQTIQLPQGIVEIILVESEYSKAAARVAKGGARVTAPQLKAGLHRHSVALDQGLGNLQRVANADDIAKVGNKPLPKRQQHCRPRLLPSPWPSIGKIAYVRGGLGCQSVQLRTGFPHRCKFRRGIPTAAKFVKQGLVDLQNARMLEVACGIGGARSKQLMFRPKIQPVRVQQAGNDGRAAAVHSHNTDSCHVLPSNSQRRRVHGGPIIVLFPIIKL